MRAVALFRFDQAVRNQGHVSRQLVGADVVERVELILSVFDEGEGVEDGNLAPELFAVAARDGEILALDIQDHDRPLVIEDRRDHGADALAAACAGDNEVMPAAPSLRIVLDVAQEFALVQGEGQAGLVALQPGHVTRVHPSRLPRAGAGFAVAANARIEDRHQRGADSDGYAKGPEREGDRHGLFLGIRIPRQPLEALPNGTGEGPSLTCPCLDCRQYVAERASEGRQGSEDGHAQADPCEELQGCPVALSGGPEGIEDGGHGDDREGIGGHRVDRDRLRSEDQGGSGYDHSADHDHPVAGFQNKTHDRSSCASGNRICQSPRSRSRWVRRSGRSRRTML